mgnify:CR=1 FL=1
MKIKDVLSHLEQWAPLSYQESYDNAGLIIGDRDQELIGASITLDVTEAVIDEAIEKGYNLVIAHHPLIFKGLKKIGNQHWLERCVTKAIKNDIAIYAIHTNLDNVHTGVNWKIAEKVGLEDHRILSPKEGRLKKIIAFIPVEDTETVLNAMYAAGAGQIGDYDQCSFRVTGTGSFRPGSTANPAIGKRNTQEHVQENRIELIFPDHLSGKVLTALKNAHRYEEVAYYLQSLDNANQEVGSGMIGKLPEAMEPHQFLDHLKKSMNLRVVKHTSFTKKKVQKIAVCGGAGIFLLKDAIRQGADAFITGDVKHHDFFEANEQTVIVDIGHYESEVFTKELIYDELNKKLTNIALHLSDVNTNPIHYY